jgi:hypothetical protein
MVRRDQLSPGATRAPLTCRYYPPGKEETESLTLVINLAYNIRLLSEAGIALTVSFRDCANLGLAFAINLLLVLIGAAVTFGLRPEVGAQTYYLRQIATKRPTGDSRSRAVRSASFLALQVGDERHLDRNALAGAAQL